MQKKVFISHSQEDKEIANMICNSLEDTGIGCWIAPRDIPYGNDWAGEIAQAIEGCVLFLFILSEHSNSSRQCPKELTIADNAGVPIICIKIDNVEMNSGLKYHLTVSQILTLDVTQIKEQIDMVVAAINKKIMGGETTSDDGFQYNIDQELINKYNDLFGEDAKKEGKTRKKTLIEEKLDEIRVNKFMDHFIQGLDKIGNTSRSSNIPNKEQSNRLLLSPLTEEGDFLAGKHFSIPNMPGYKTLVFQLKEDCVDYLSKTSYCTCVLLESMIDEEHDSTIVFVEKPPKDGASMIFFHISPEENKVFTNVGLLQDNSVSLSKKPMLTAIQTFAVDDNNQIHLSEVGYNVSEVPTPHFITSASVEEKWVDAEIMTDPIIVIDPVTAQPVLREVYYDEKEKRMKARMKIKPHKSYFSFQITGGKQELSNLQQGEFYRKGIHGFPKNMIKAAELLELDNSADAKFQIALIFKEQGEFHDDDMYRETLLQSATEGCIDAIVELTLSIVFDGFSGESVDKCLDLLKNKVKDDDGVGHFVIGYIMEEKDLQEAFNHYMIAARADYLPAISRLNIPSGDMLDNISEEELFDLFKDLYHRNSGLSEYCMGCACFYGYDMESRSDVGINLIKSAAYLGDIESQRLIFDIYDSDEKYIDKAQALFWLEKISDYDDSVRNKLANRYLDGIGCNISDESDRRAFELLTTLEHSDYHAAINNLAWMYKMGRGCKQDYIKAKGLFEQAAEMGSITSLYHLGTIYEEGLGVKQDLEKAIYYYKLAAKEGNEKSINRLELLSS